ncbi:serine-threonine/tyrosine-protein kinase catalytic domain-containing protein, partial [Tanacetum coccineum]
EYMPRGTLEDHLHKRLSSLTWVRRLKICIGAARGLDYLHSGSGIEHGVIHRDFKSSNILLHNSWEAKISDFGLSKVIPRNQPSTYVNTLVKGTFGYLDPNYFQTGRLTKSDVYAFGVVLTTTNHIIIHAYLEISTRLQA